MGRTYEPWSNERLDRLLLTKGGSLKRIGDVTTFREKVLVKCQNCGFEYMATPQTLEKSGCPKCYQNNKVGAKRKAKYTFSEIRDIFDEHGYVVPKDEKYENNKTPLKVYNKDTGKTENLTLRAFLYRIQHNDDDD